MELSRYKITCNALAPVAYTRLTEDLAMIKAMGDGVKDMLAPEHIAPIAVFLGSDLAADVNGTIVGVQGTQVSIYKMVQSQGVAPRGSEWTPEELRERWGEINK
jgi:NAD(P)-dependent dehydrogenase (short-subunit alcohol dehydrogenase family)